MIDITQTMAELPDVIMKGTRRATLFDLGVTLIRGNVTEEIVTEILKAINWQSCQPPINAYQLEKCNKWIMQYAKTDKPLQPRTPSNAVLDYLLGQSL